LVQSVGEELLPSLPGETRIVLETLSVHRSPNARAAVTAIGTGLTTATTSQTRASCRHGGKPLPNQDLQPV
jgi:hypothetical protein